MKCQFCGHAMHGSERNTKEFAQILYTCPECGASVKKLTAHNPYAPEQTPFREPPAVGEWSR